MPGGEEAGKLEARRKKQEARSKKQERKDLSLWLLTSDL